MKTPQLNMVVTSSPGATLRNPRELFPLHDDYIRSTWVQRERSTRAREYEDLYPYFLASEASPKARQEDGSSTVALAKKSFNGIQTGSTKVDEFRRAFRRLEPEHMFRAPRLGDEPVCAYWGTDSSDEIQRSSGRRGKAEGFVLVPANELREMRAIEGALRHERNLLKAQCLLSLDEGEVSAHRPLEVTRMAVHEACNREMASAVGDYRSWISRYSAPMATSGSDSVAKKAESGKVPDCPRSLSRMLKPLAAEGLKRVGMSKRVSAAAAKDRLAELRRVPPSRRPARWILMRDERELNNEARERDGMFREEMKQRFRDRYSEAWERRHDYDLYCALASRFWPLEAESFRRVGRPGRRLLREIETPARAISRMWRKWWPLRKDRKRKACTALQAVWRGFRVRRRWGPIVKLRVRHGRRACIAPCFVSWRRRTRVKKWARRRFDELRGRWTGICFRGWAKWTVERKEEKRRILQRAARTLKNVTAYKGFRSWRAYTIASRRAKRLFARVVGLPTLHAWILFTAEAKEARRRNQAATAIQRHVRGSQARVRYVARRVIIAGLSRLLKARRDREFLRRLLVARHCEAAEELFRAGKNGEIARGLSKEQRRLARLEREKKAAERHVKRAVKRRWKTDRFRRKTSPGMTELRRMVGEVRAEWREREHPGRGGGMASLLLQTLPGGRLLSSLRFKITPFVERRGKGIGRKEGGDGSRERVPTVRNAGSVSAGGTDPAADGFPGHRVASGRLSEAGSGSVGTEAYSRGGGKKRGEEAQAGRANDPAAVECEARRRIMSRELVLAREVVEHNFDARNPPPLKCCAPGCGRTFTEDAHYLAHWAAGGDGSPALSSHESSGEEGVKLAENATRVSGIEDSTGAIRSTGLAELPEVGHPALGGSEIASFHLGMADMGREEGEGGSTGFDLIASYVRREWGLGEVYNTLLFWRTVDSWRCHDTRDRRYLLGARVLREVYLEADAVRRPRLSAETRDSLLLRLGGIVDEEGDGDAEEASEVNSGRDGIGDGGSGAAEASSDGGSRGRGHTGLRFPSSCMPILEEEILVDTDSASSGPTGPLPGKWGRRGEGMPSDDVEAAMEAGRRLWPTSFDDAQWEALAYLCRVAGPGFWASDLGRCHLRQRQLTTSKSRDVAHEIVRIEYRSRLANEASEVKAQLRRQCENTLSGLAGRVTEAASDVVGEEMIRSAAAEAERIITLEIEDARETDIISEAASIETIWAIEPSLLEGLLAEAIDNFLVMKEEQALMEKEDDWGPTPMKVSDGDLEDDTQAPKSISREIVIDFSSISGGRTRAEKASETIQCAWRQHAARVEARHRLAKAFVKRPTPGGDVYYENLLLGTSSWERPYLAYRLFPDSTW